MNQERAILIAEDEETDVFLLRRAFKEAELQNPLHVVNDGCEAVAFLERLRHAADEVMPALVMLDLMLPGRTGLDVLKWMQSDPVLRTVPAMIFSSSAHRDDVECAYATGANFYVVKPSSTIERAEIARFIKQWLRFVELPLACSQGYTAAKLHMLNGPSPL